MDPLPTTTYLQFDPAPQLARKNILLFGSVQSTFLAHNPNPQGTVEFYEIVGGVDLLIGSGTLNPSSAGYSTVSIVVNTFGAGTHQLFAKFVGPDPDRAGSTSETKELVVIQHTSTASISRATSEPLEAGNPFQLLGFANSTGPAAGEGATLTFTRVGQETPICVVTFVYFDPNTCTVPGQPAGTSTYRVTYSGNADVEGSTSGDLELTIGPNQLHATGVGVDAGTVYPYRDGYRDTVSIRGTRQEPISAGIKIYSPGGTLLKTVAIASGTGLYSYAWNGRNAAGTWYPEGKYKVVQTLKDSNGLTKAYASYVQLWRKKLYTKTATVGKAGSAPNAKGTYLDGTVTINATGGYTHLRAPGSSSWAAAGYELTLPTAAVYKSMYVRIYGRHYGTTGLTDLGAQNFVACPRTTSTNWNEACFSAWVDVPTTAGTTLHYYRTANLSSAYRSGGKVRLLVASNAGQTWIYKAQVVVTYGVLGY